MAMRTLGVALWLCVALPAFAQERADRVEFVVRGKEGARTTRTGFVLEETPTKVVLRLTGGDRLEIPSDDVVEIDYEGAPSAMVLGRGAERNRQWEAALGHYEKALKETQANQRQIACQLRFKIADLRLQAAEAGGAESQAQAAAALRQFVKEFPAARQTLPAWEKLGQALLQSGGDPAEALAGLKALREKLASQPAAAARCELVSLRLMLAEVDALTATKPAAAKERAAAAFALAAKLKASGAGAALPETTRLHAQALAAVGRGAEALAEIDSLFAAAEEGSGRALLLFERAELRRRLGQPEAARWDYLKLEALYPQERELQPKVLARLAEVFAALGDTARAREYRERSKR